MQDSSHPCGGGKFAKLSEEFIREMLVLSPSSASHAGYRQQVDPKTGKIVALDGLLDKVSAAGMAEKPPLCTVARALPCRGSTCPARHPKCGRLATHRQPDGLSLGRHSKVIAPAS